MPIIEVTSLTTIANDRIVEQQYFFDHGAALEAAGLAE